MLGNAFIAKMGVRGNAFIAKMGVRENVLLLQKELRIKRSVQIIVIYHVQ